MKFVLSQAEVNALNDDQKGAIFDALVTSVFADGKAEQAEIARFEHEVAQVPWGKDPAALSQMVQASRDKLGKVTSGPELIAFIERIAGALPDQGLREKVFRMMASLAFADSSVNQEENNVLNAFQQKFGIPDDRLPEIAAAVKGN
jgi:uncharacterized tellurite resistance protein B-like protein